MHLPSKGSVLVDLLFQFRNVQNVLYWILDGTFEDESTSIGSDKRPNLFLWLANFRRKKSYSFLLS